MLMGAPAQRRRPAGRQSMRRPQQPRTSRCYCAAHAPDARHHAESLALTRQLGAFLHYALDHGFDGHCSIETQHGTRQLREPGLLLFAIAAFAGAVLVVRRPFDEFLAFAMPIAARRHALGTEMGSLARPEARQPNVF